MIIKPVKDTPALRQLWEEAFGDPPEAIDAFFRTGFSAERSLCIWEAEMPLAMLYWFDCRWQNRKIAYIYAVAVAKSCRGQGLSRTLMDAAHARLKSQGYAGSILVPAKEGLFRLYEKLGYTPCCPMTRQTVTPEGNGTVSPISAEEYAALRQTLLPKSGVLQDENALHFYGTYGSFYRCGDSIFCAAREKNSLYIQEFLGDSGLLPGIVEALGCAEGTVFLPGGAPRAMYRPFSPDSALPGYFGIPLN